MAEQETASWTRIQTLADASGWPAVLAMAGRPALPLEIAEDEAVKLKQAGAKVLRDLTGRPCVRTPEPVVTAWLAGLDARVTELAEAIERDIERSRQPLVTGIEHGTLEVPGGG